MKFGYGGDEPHYIRIRGFDPHHIRMWCGLSPSEVNVPAPGRRIERQEAGNEAGHGAGLKSAPGRGRLRFLPAGTCLICHLGTWRDKLSWYYPACATASPFVGALAAHARWTRGSDLPRRLYWTRHGVRRRGALLE